MKLHTSGINFCFCEDSHIHAGDVNLLNISQ